jgi:hypothetical protein
VREGHLVATIDERPWERLGRGRLDAGPHRGVLLRVLAVASVVCGLLSWCLVVPCLVGLPLAVATFVMAREDMRLMRAGLVDRGGYGLTHAAWDRSIDGLCLNGPALTCLVLLIAHIVSEL